MDPEKAVPMRRAQEVVQAEQPAAEVAVVVADTVAAKTVQHYKAAAVAIKMAV